MMSEQRDGMKAQLAAAQAREERLREALERWVIDHATNGGSRCLLCGEEAAAYRAIRHAADCPLAEDLAKAAEDNPEA